MGSLEEKGASVLFDDHRRLVASGPECTRVSGGELAAFFQEINRRHDGEQIVFLCVGTDRSSGDALGPLVGSRLVELGFEYVIGTLPRPCDADNLKSMILDIPPGSVIIAIDACLGASASVGSFLISEHPLIPARAVGTVLPAVGDYSVAAVVNVNSPKPYATLQMTSLHLVMGMAKQIALAAAEGFQRG